MGVIVNKVNLIDDKIGDWSQQTGLRQFGKVKERLINFQA